MVTPTKPAQGQNHMTDLDVDKIMGISQASKIANQMKFMNQTRYTNAKNLIKDVLCLNFLWENNLKLTYINLCTETGEFDFIKAKTQSTTSLDGDVTAILRGVQNDNHYYEVGFGAYLYKQLKDLTEEKKLAQRIGTFEINEWDAEILKPIKKKYLHGLFSKEEENKMNLSGGFPTCSLTKWFCREPVTANDGQCYEGPVLMAWLINSRFSPDANHVRLELDKKTFTIDYVAIERRQNLFIQEATSRIFIKKKTD